ncbi:MAG: pentapeptide repeat-containing protein [Cyanobacteriota bacterium]|nr:pentapeptide repeat-containing protein [Cyanobacteriota bacterium]
MARRLFRNIWKVLNTEIELSGETSAAGVEVMEKLFALAGVLEENKDAAQLKPIIDNLDSFLDVLNSPLGQVTEQTLPFVSIATSILKYVVKQSKGEPTLADSVELVSEVAYLESLRQFLRDRPEIQLQQKEASEEIRKKIKKLGEGIEFGDRGARETLICFHDSPLAKAFNEILEGRLEESGLAAEVAATVTKRVSRGTHRYMKEAVAEVKDDAKKLAGIYGDGWLRDLEAYGSIDKYLNDVIAAQPEEKVFDEEFVFRQVYVPLQVKPVKSNGEVDRSAGPENIEEWAKRTLLDEKKLDRVLFVQGGPGRGKSVFCRMFGDLVRRELHPIYTPILIRLRDVTAFEMDIDRTLSAAVGRDFVTNDSGWLTDSNTRFLFLLDGFDELLLERGARYDLKLFLDQVAQFQKRAAKNSERGHRVIITGRPLALYGIERLMPQNLERVGIVPMADDIQEQWLANWQAVVDADEAEAAAKTEKFREFLRDETCPEQVKELAREPLLLYLLAAMQRDGQLEAQMFAGADAGQGKVLVYEQALEWVLEKQRSEDGRNFNQKLTKLESEDLRALLQETGLCAVQSGREHTPISTIESRLLEKKDEGAIRLIENARKTGSDNALKNALAAFYLKSAPGAENSVEFFHKSFGEFLSAERMAETMEEWTIKIGKRRKKFAVSDDELNKQVYDLFGYGALTAEVVEYLMALLVKKEKENEVDLVVLFDRLHEFYLCWCDGEFIDAREDTLPQKKARQLQQEKIGQRQVDVYGGLNVLILLLELHRYGQSRGEEKIVFHPCGKPEDEDFDRKRLLRIIGYSQCLGTDTAFVQIVGKFLHGSYLSEIYLCDAKLQGANLSDANLSMADLHSADLSDANLSHVDMQNANIRATYFSGADFTKANLSLANLSWASLAYANISGADLSGAYFKGSDLTLVKWDSTTKWSNSIGLDKLIRVPKALEQDLEFATAFKFSQKLSQIREGKIEEAIAAYHEAKAANPSLEVSVKFWNELCWFGSLHDYAADVLFAGEKAVELIPNDGMCRDARGLARGLTGNIQGAIEDFQAALDTGFFDPYWKKEKKQKRQRWLEALRAGINPFTPEELLQLREDEL